MVNFVECKSYLNEAVFKKMKYKKSKGGPYAKVVR